MLGNRYDLYDNDDDHMGYTNSNYQVFEKIESVPKYPLNLCNTIYKIITKTIKNSKRKGGSFVLKNVLEKTFDKLEWSFIYKTLKFFKFPNNIRSLIMTKTEFFSPSKGIRQGDSVSPYIFILCMKTLSLHISHQVNLGVRELIRINHMAPPLSHLFYADDLTLMARAHPKNVDTIANSLKNFCALSGQSINRSKSSCSQDLPIWSLPRFPILSRTPKHSDFNYIIDKINNRLWGSTSINKKLHYLNWDIVTKQKSEGVLDITKAKIKNKAGSGNR
uniref:Reverse transcriptase domain-containing protein n=1 Tax=Solanum lycopersicum TaxID=4081 RepID=A0A3Q7HQD8_SOLLC